MRYFCCHRSSHDSGHWSWWSFWSLHSGWFWWLAKALRKFWGASGDFELLRGWPCTCWYIICTSSCLMAPVRRTCGLRSATLVLANWWQSCVGCVDFSQCRSNYGLAFITVEYFPAVFFHICLGNQQSFEQGNQLTSRWNTSCLPHSILLWTFLAVVLPGKWRPYIVLAIGKIKCTVGKYLYYKYTCMYYSLSTNTNWLAEKN